MKKDFNFWKRIWLLAALAWLLLLNRALELNLERERISMEAWAENAESGAGGAPEEESEETAEEEVAQNSEEEGPEGKLPEERNEETAAGKRAEKPEEESPEGGLQEEESEESVAKERAEKQEEGPEEELSEEESEGAAEEERAQSSEEEGPEGKLPEERNEETAAEERAEKPEEEGPEEEQLKEKSEETAAGEGTEKPEEDSPKGELPEEKNEETEAGKSGEESAASVKESGKGLQSQAETREGQECDRIRVLLTDSDFASCIHSSATVSYEGEEKTYTPQDPVFRLGTVRIGSEEGEFTVSSIRRAEGPPCYKGILEIRKIQDGLLLINELPMETYLESVVPGEMPPSSSMEALKAQAVCARTYAYRQMQEDRLKEYGADVDDSVRFQVYGNLSPHERSSLAVKETEGQVLVQNGNLIEAYYFSTSAGATSTDEVWGAKEPAPYLKSVSCAFDSEEPWSRWEVSIPWQLLEERAQNYLSDAGELLGLEITAKSEGGAVIGFTAVCRNGNISLEGEYQVREFFSPQGCVLTGRDGTVLQSGALLPSAYFSLDAVQGENAVLRGGGYGHGVGMSQNGADEMGELGYNYEEILNYFFRDVELCQVESLSASAP